MFPASQPTPAVRLLRPGRSEKQPHLTVAGTPTFLLGDGRRFSLSALLPKISHSSVRGTVKLTRNAQTAQLASSLLIFADYERETA